MLIQQHSILRFCNFLFFNAFFIFPKFSELILYIYRAKRALFKANTTKIKAIYKKKFFLVKLQFQPMIELFAKVNEYAIHIKKIYCHVNKKREKILLINKSMFLLLSFKLYIFISLFIFLTIMEIIFRLKKKKKKIYLNL